MGNDASEVVVGANGTVWVAPAETTGPDDVGTAMGSVDGDWVELGYTSEDGATFTEGKDITDIGAWQSFFPIRKIVTGRTVEVSFALRQWNKDTVEFALGGTVENNDTEYMYTPPSPEDIVESSLVLEWFDGDKSYRLYMPSGIVSDNVETNLVRTAAADLPVTFSATDPGVDESGDPVAIYTIFTDDPAFATSS